MIKNFTQFVNEAKFTSYSNNELAAYIRELSKQRADAASNGQTSLLNGLHKDIEKAQKELDKRSKKLKALSRTDESISEGFNANTSGDDFGTFAVKLLAARDQSHVFHWQTKSFAQHEALGKFYDQFLLDVDALVEMIMGIKERPQFDEATITLKGYSEGAIAEFFEHLYEVLNEEMKRVIDPMHEEVYDQARVIISQIDKLKYLLSLS